MSQYEVLIQNVYTLIGDFHMYIIDKLVQMQTKSWRSESNIIYVGGVK